MKLDKSQKRSSKSKDALKSVATKPISKSSKKKDGGNGKRNSSKNDQKLEKQDEIDKRLPPVEVSKMVVSSIKALGQSERKGSSFMAIKRAIKQKWLLNIKRYDSKIKEFITEAMEKGDIKQVKGTGFSGRFTLPGMKTPRLKNPISAGGVKLTSKFDNDVLEYTPKVTKRDRAREEGLMELKKYNEEMLAEFEKQEMELEEKKRATPKKKTEPKQEIWNVESIKNIKEVEGKKYYLVKWEGYKSPGWENEENILDCQDAVNEYHRLAKQKKEAKERNKKLLAEGNLDVVKIMDVDISTINNKTKRKFLVRWKGIANSSWEPEEKLKCTDMINSFMEKKEKLNTDRIRRVAPKQVDKLSYVANSNVGKQSPKRKKRVKKNKSKSDKSKVAGPEKRGKPSKSNPPEKHIEQTKTVEASAAEQEKQISENN